MKPLLRPSLVLLVLTWHSPAGADESQLKLRDAPEVMMVRASCSVCHSVDYIEMNSRFMNRATWEAEVRKMIKVMGAQMREEDVAPIVNYLTHEYGVE